MKLSRAPDYEYITEVSKSHLECILEVKKFNPYHGADGRFASSSGYASFTIRTKDPKKQHWADMAIAREKERANAGDGKNNPYGFKMISGPHSIMDDIKATNPNWDPKNYKYNSNCQRCVPTYEMRRRGYDVTAKPRIRGYDPTANEWDNVFKGQKFELCYNGKSDLEAKMANWGEGARAEVYVAWKHSRSSHVFVAEQIGGKTRYMDPQKGDMDVSDYFKHASFGRTKVARIDHLEPNVDLIKGCCE